METGYCSIKERQLKKWATSHATSLSDIADVMGTGITDLEYRLEFWEYFTEEEMESLIELMGAKSAFYVIYFTTKAERKRVYEEVFMQGKPSSKPHKPRSRGKHE